MIAKDDLILSLFLDLIAVANSQNLEAYTPEMADEDEELLAGVSVKQ